MEESLIGLTVVRMDDDGNPITPSIEPGRLMVMGPPTQTTTTTTQIRLALPFLPLLYITIYVSKPITETITTIERIVTITTSQTSQMTLFMILSIVAIFIAVIVLIISLTALRKKGTS